MKKIVLYKNLLVVIMLVLVLGMNIQSASAYFTLPYRWPDNIFYYKIDSSANDLTSLISNAANSWNTTTPVSISNSSTGEILIKKVNDSTVTWSGKTNLYVGSIGGKYYYNQGIVQINQAKIGSYTSLQKQGVIAHEFGHVIALADDNGYLLYGDPKVLMLGYDSERHKLGIYTPQSVNKYVPGVGYVYGDIEGANYLY
ncbi:hypothetical protein CTH_2711 [Carboxydocella thermautotrophica]|nr:hypothetical protein CTH_2711 [Carboxydocella thermautotrophica]